MPAFDREGMLQLIAWYAASRILAQFDAGYAGSAQDDKPSYKPCSTQDAIDKVVARVKEARCQRSL